MPINKQGIIALASGGLTLMVFGSIYTFGTLTPYISSYLYYRQQESSSTALSILFTITGIMMNVGIAISTIFLPNISNRRLCIIAMIAMCTSIFISSFMQTFVGYVIFFGITYGMSIGIGYYPPIKNCYEHLPDRKGLCSGICMCGFGLGSAIFNYLIIGLVNPNNQRVDPVTKQYPQSVVDNLPFALKVVSGTYLLIGMLGAVFISPKKKPIQQSESQIVVKNKQKYQFVKYLQTFKRQKAYLLMIQFAFLAPFGMFTAFNYKRIAFQRNNYFLENDYIVTTIGSVGIFSNGIFRSAWGFLFDNFSFKQLTLTINILLIIFCATILFAVNNVVTYFIIIPLTYLAYGGLYAILPTQSIRILGVYVGNKIFWLVFSGFTFASIIQFVTQFFVLNNMGEEGYYYCVGIFQILLLISLGIGVFHNYEEQVKQVSNNQASLLGQSRQETQQDLGENVNRTKGSLQQSEIAK